MRGQIDGYILQKQHVRQQISNKSMTSDDFEGVRASIREARQHGLTNSTQVFRQTPAALIHEVFIQLVPRIRDDISEFYCSLQVPVIIELSMLQD